MQVQTCFDTYTPRVCGRNALPRRSRTLLSCMCRKQLCAPCLLCAVISHTTPTLAQPYTLQPSLPPRGTAASCSGFFSQLASGVLSRCAGRLGHGVLLFSSDWGRLERAGNTIPRFHPSRFLQPRIGVFPTRRGARIPTNARSAGITPRPAHSILMYAMHSIA